MASRVQQSMKKDEIFEVARELEEELRIAIDNIRELEDNLAAERHDLSVVEAQLAKLEQADPCGNCPVDDVPAPTAARTPSIGAAIQSLQKFNERGGLPHLRAAERFLRAEIVRLRR